MSLNGLDTPEVQDAYQAAVTEAGGWFLLKYTSRDSVDLLGRGRNGVAEARNVMAAYAETSPLYGLLIYRRRKILIKYIPEGTSRLLQARTTVHFGDILERYSPYETLLEISTSESLNDTALAASFQLRTASTSGPSPIASTSRLDEIREDGEDGSSVAELPKASERVSNAQKFKAERRAEGLKRKLDRAEKTASTVQTSTDFTPSSVPSVPSVPKRSISPPPAPKPAVSQILVRENSGRTSITSLESPYPHASSKTEHRDSDTTTDRTDSPQAASDLPDSASQTTDGLSETTNTTEIPSSPEKLNRKGSTRTGSRDIDLPVVPMERPATAGNNAGPDVHSARPSVDDDPYDLRKYDEWFKPKVKLGPRPVDTSAKSKRPAAARVSALPANFKPAMKKQEPSRPRSSAAQSSNSVAPSRETSSALSRETTSSTHSRDTLPTLSRDTPSALSQFSTHPFTPSPPPIPDEPEYKPRPVSRGSIKSAPSHKSTAMTPDKLRLMKALELRKKQLRKSQEQLSTKPTTVEDAPEVPKIPHVPERNPMRDTRKVTPPYNQAPVSDDTQPQANKADSGIQLQYERPEKQEEPKSEVTADEPGALQTDPGMNASDESMTRASAAPPNHDHPNSVAQDTIAGAPPELKEDATSSSDSLAPTVRPISAQQLGEEVTRVPTIVMADGSKPETLDPEIRDSVSPNEGPLASDTLEEPQSPRRQNSDLARRRRGLVEPLEIEVKSGNPDDFASDDEELLDELQTATVQQAQPMTVSRSPMLPTFPSRRPSAEATSVRSINITRAASIPVATTSSDRLTPNAYLSSESSSPTMEKHDPMAASRSVSSGISRRIQALAEMSNRPLTPESAQQEARERKANKPRPISLRTKSNHNRAAQSWYSTSSGETTPTWGVQHDPLTNRNSVSVTARIVRPSIIDELGQEPSELQLSELTINHSREPDTRDELAPINTSRGHSAASSPAMSPVSRGSGDVRQLLHSGSFFGKHKQPSSPGLEDFPPPPKARNTSATSLVSSDENTAPKESGRTSRFFKRMSNMNFGPKRRSNAPSATSLNSLSSSISEEGSSSSHQTLPKRMSTMTEKADTPPAVVVGDLNVQFPDSLLWKRRIVTIDDGGNLSFAIAQAMEIHKGIAQKQYPLTDFQHPFAPDMDQEELAHSLVLEFLDGTSLQLACEDAMTQRQVLGLLRTYWTAWTDS